jgi:hypothetical protein
LAGLAKVDQKLDHGGANLAEFAGEFVGAGLFDRIAFAAEEFGASVGEGMEEAFELGGEARGLFFAIDTAGAHIAHRDGGTQDLSRFFLSEVADEFGEERKPVHFGEEHVDRQIDAEGLGHLAEAGAQIARGCGGRFLGARPGEVLGIVADENGARRLASLAGDSGARLQLADQAGPPGGFGGQFAAGFDEDGAAREP